MVTPSPFDLLIFSLGNAALMGLGLLPRPEDQSVQKNLDEAQHNIELLATLQQKTKGNLSGDEERLLSSLLYDLRLKFVDAKRQA